MGAGTEEEAVGVDVAGPVGGTPFIGGGVGNVVVEFITRIGAAVVEVVAATALGNKDVPPVVVAPAAVAVAVAVAAATESEVDVALMPPDDNVVAVVPDVVVVVEVAPAELSAGPRIPSARCCSSARCSCSSARWSCSSAEEWISAPSEAPRPNPAP